MLYLCEDAEYARAYRHVGRVQTLAFRLAQRLEEIRGIVTDMADWPGGEEINSLEVSRHLEKARQALLAGAPFRLCGCTLEDGPRCERCKNRGWLSARMASLPVSPSKDG